ncbi:MAG: hypothetical protein ACRD2N_26550 [Vicinamibacterales bacterium]
MTRRSRSRHAILIAALAVVPLDGAQSPVTPADAPDFMGVWTMSMEGPQGSFEQELTLKDKDGKVFGEMVNAMMPLQEISDISKSGADLVLKYQGNFQGNPFDATITLSPSGFEKVKVVFDVNNGMFTMNGSATKKN